MKNNQYVLYAAFALYSIAFLSALLKRNRTSLWLLITGSAVHAVFLVLRAWAGEIFVTGALFQGVFLLPWAMALCVILNMLFPSDETSSGTEITVVIFFTAMSMMYPRGIMVPMPNKITAWSYSFFLTEVCAQACFLLGGWFAVSGIRRRSDPLIVRKLLSWGFVLYTVAQIVGAIWAFLGWGSTFRWGAKHLQSAVIWVYYANYLHMKYIQHRTSRDQLWYAVAGSILVAYCVFSYYFNEMMFSRIGG